MNSADSILDWIRAQGAKCVAIQGPQGVGKSTLAAELVACAERRGLRAIAVSVDDFYLTRAEQVALSQAQPGDPHLAQRGYPGTHDISLGQIVLEKLTALRAGERMRIPRYDKSAHGGRGDRAPESAWTEVAGPTDLVVLEGWFLGFRPGSTDPRWEAVDHALAQMALRWWSHIQAWVFLFPQQVDFFVSWRTEAEEKRRASGAEAMSEAEIFAYCALFQEGYARYLPPLRANPPEPPLCFEVERDRARRSV